MTNSPQKKIKFKVNDSLIIYEQTHTDTYSILGSLPFIYNYTPLFFLERMILTKKIFFFILAIFLLNIKQNSGSILKSSK